MNSGSHEAASSANNLKKGDFSWKLEGRITVVDNGARLPAQKNFIELMALNAFGVIAFDPASKLHGEDHLKEVDEFQLIPHTLLGNGEMATLNACLDPSMSGTLEPLEAGWVPKDKRQGSRVLTRLPINTITLDSIEGLDSIDWLLLDEFNDSLAVLEHGAQALRDTLLIHVRIPFLLTHRRQADLAGISQWMASHGFQCYRLNTPDYQSHFPEALELEKHQASQIASVEAIFTPDDPRIRSLTPDRLTKLAFLLDTIHDIHDYSYELLAKVDPVVAENYLISRGYLSQYDDEEATFTLTAEYSPAPW